MAEYVKGDWVMRKNNSSAGVYEILDVRAAGMTVCRPGNPDIIWFMSYNDAIPVDYDENETGEEVS